MSFAAPDSAQADQYRVLRQGVERIARTSGARVFAITSPRPGDGKTVTTLNLAGSLAQAPRTNLLVVEADLHRPSLGRYLGLTSQGPGLAEVILQPEFDLERAVKRLEPIGISMLPRGAIQAAPYELLGSPRFGAVLAEMRRRYDYVLIDTPPILPVADCRSLEPWVDGFIVVVAAHRTPRKALVEALRLLEPNRVFGVVFNRDDRPLESYAGYYRESAGGGSPATRGRR